MNTRILLAATLLLGCTEATNLHRSADAGGHDGGVTGDAAVSTDLGATPDARGPEDVGPTDGHPRDMGPFVGRHDMAVPDAQHPSDAVTTDAEPPLPDAAVPVPDARPAPDAMPAHDAMSMPAPDAAAPDAAAPDAMTVPAPDAAMPDAAMPDAVPMPPADAGPVVGPLVLHGGRLTWIAGPSGAGRVYSATESTNGVYRLRGRLRAPAGGGP